jgi:TRAP-type mannitol/chloroaromatic compound transport system permease small subunit
MIDNINRYAAYFSAFVLAVLVMLVVYDATMRYLFQTGSIALQELEWHFFDVVILLGIAFTLQKNLHVRVDIFYDSFSERTRHFIDIFAFVFFIFPFSLLIIYVGFDFVMLSFEQLEGSSNPGGLPYRYIVKSLMPLAFILLGLQVFSEFFKRLKILK